MIREFRGNYYFLSNFYDSPVLYNGVSFENNEAAFQAQKCVDSKDIKAFSKLNPSEAKRMGRRTKLRCDWEQVKTIIMYKIVLAKFTQNEKLKEMLISTGDELLEEGNTWGDKIWGTVNGQGQNLLGKILMRVRNELR